MVDFKEHLLYTALHTKLKQLDSNSNQRTSYGGIIKHSIHKLPRLSLLVLVIIVITCN